MGLTVDGDEGHPLTEEEIRPSLLREEQRRLFEADVSRLVEGAEHFERVDCPACGSPDSEFAFAKMGIRYRCCLGCSTMYVSPRPTPHQLAEYYRTSDNYQFWATHIFPASEDSRRERIVVPRLARLVGICKAAGVPTGHLVEVGPGFGTFCEEAIRSAAFGKVTAIEPTPSLAEACRSRGVEVVQARVEEVTVGQIEQPDVIAAFEVIEHLHQPGRFVSDCSRLLSPDGLLVLSCPSVSGFDVASLGPLSDAVDAEHLNYFTPDSLTLLLNGNGFEVIDVQTPGQLDAELVRSKVLEGVYDLSGQPFLRQVLIDDWDRLGVPFQQFLAENRLSSHLWVAAVPR